MKTLLRINYCITLTMSIHKRNSLPGVVQQNRHCIVAQLAWPHSARVPAPAATPPPPATAAALGPGEQHEPAQ